MPDEYRMLMKAHALKRVDIERDIHLQAYINRVATATEQKGKKTVPVYQKFTDLFDYEQRIEKVMNPAKEESKEEKKIINLFKQANKL